jgi:hypothetical protein
MEPWRVQAQGRSGTLPGHLSSRRHEARARASRQEATAYSGPPPHPPGTPCAAHTHAVVPRSPYGRSCRRCVTIIQSGHRATTILKVAATHPRSGGSWKGTSGQRHLHEALRSREDPTPRQQEGSDHQQLSKPYARSGRKTCRGDPEAFTAGNEKGQLSWPFTSRADRI